VMGANTSAAGCCHEANGDVSSSSQPPKEIVEADRSSCDSQLGSACSDERQSSRTGAQAQLTRQSSHFSRYDRMQNMQQVTVDTEIIRAIPLHRTLRRFGQLWRTSPVDLDDDRRNGLWTKSCPAERFDVFLSHTWQSSWRWKYLSLLLRSGSPAVLVAWTCAAGLAFALSMFDVLELPFEYEPHHVVVQASCPLGFWVMLLGNAAVIVAVFASPYLPCRKQCACFLDAVSINQADSELQERGVYGIGGFLKVSDELLVMWSPLYLTRLWCVYEIAMFRYANPKGRITFAPSFVEAAALCLWFFTALTTFFLWTSLAFPLSLDLLLVEWSLAFLPVILCAHFLRRSLYSKQMLLMNLENFDLDTAQCRVAFDREFVHQSIVQWYGSVGAFNAYVQGPLRQELLDSSSSFQMPLVYFLVILTPGQGSSLEELLGLLKAGEPWNVVLSHALAHNIGLCIAVMFSLKFLFKQCERFAAPRQRMCMDCLTSVLIFLAFGLVTLLLAGLSLASAYFGIFTALAWAVVMLAAAYVSFKGSPLRRCNRSASNGDKGDKV